MLISSTNKIKLYFQVTFPLVLPSSLLKFLNQLTQQLNTVHDHCCFLAQLNGTHDSQDETQPFHNEAAATSSTWHPKIYFIQMARHRKSSLYGRGIAGFDEFIHKKIPHNLAVLSSSSMLWSKNVIWNSCIFHFVTQKIFPSSQRYNRNELLCQSSLASEKVWPHKLLQLQPPNKN